MAFENLLLAYTFTASGNNMSADTDQFTFVRVGATDGEVAQANAGDRPFGVLQNKPKTGEGANVGLIGITKLRCGNGPIAFGDMLEPDASGNAIEHTTNIFTGAVALSDGATSDVIPALIHLTSAAT